MLCGAMEKELIKVFEAVKKAADAAAVDGGVDSSPEEERCLDALKQLKKFPVDYRILVSSQVGKRLRHLTKHPRRKIQALASNLVEVWKNTVLEETIKKKKNGSLDDKETVKPQLASAETLDFKKIQMVNSVKVENVDIKIEENTAWHCIKVEKITQEGKQTSDVGKPTTPDAPPKPSSVTECKDELRDKVRELLSEALLKVSSEADEDLRDEVNACDPCQVAVSVESALFENWGRSNGHQKIRYRSIMFNIKDPHNPDFRRKVLLGHVKPERLLEMSPEEMASRQRQLENEKIKQKALFECQREAAPKATTNEFKCGRCGKRETTYHQMQTRSADEPMTTFVSCVNCGNNWKFC